MKFYWSVFPLEISLNYTTRTRSENYIWVHVELQNSDIDHKRKLTTSDLCNKSPLQFIHRNSSKTWHRELSGLFGYLQTDHFLRFPKTVVPLNRGTTIQSFMQIDSEAWMSETIRAGHTVWSYGACYTRFNHHLIRLSCTRKEHLPRLINSGFTQKDSWGCNSLLGHAKLCGDMAPATTRQAERK